MIGPGKFCCKGIQRVSLLYLSHIAGLGHETFDGPPQSDRLHIFLHLPSVINHVYIVPKLGHTRATGSGTDFRQDIGYCVPLDKVPGEPSPLVDILAGETQDR